MNATKQEVVPVIFRSDKSGQFKGEVTAIFPTMDANRGNMVCYAHIGQHGECSRGWYLGTRPATPAEYAPLLRELESIGYTLKIVQRAPRF